MNNRIILINPCGAGDIYDETGFNRRIPLGLLAIASFMQSRGYKIELLDTRIYPPRESWGKLEKLLEDSNINNIGLSVMTGQVPHALEICRFIRARAPQVPIVWGGVHGTLFPEQTSAHTLVDFVISGKGEIPYRELAENLRNGRPAGNIDCIAVNGKLNFEKQEINSSIDNLPPFNYDILDLQYYLGPFKHFLLSPEIPVRLLEVTTSRGCPWRCGFCINVVTGNRKWDGLPAKKVLDEIEGFVKKYNLDAVRFLDEDMFANRSRISAIAEGIIERNIPITWAANARANYFSDKYINIDFAKKLYASGMRIISIGAESGSDRVLSELIHKDITTNDLINSARVCAESGLTPVYSWIAGFPGERKDEMEKTIALMKNIIKVCPSARHSALWVFRPYPGGELYKRCLEYNLRQPESLDEWAREQNLQNNKTGYCSMDKLSWIKDKDYVSFLTKNYLELAVPLSLSLRHKGISFIVNMIFAKIAYLIDNRAWRKAVMIFPELFSGARRLVKS